MRDGELVSSSSQPSLMARMLEWLAVRDGDAVLEIGAGSGYNAALLAHRLGERQVTSVEYDVEIAESARAHLVAAGYRPEVVAGDGARGYRAGAPYDRIIATCALPCVPHAWLAQCRPGARILAPLSSGLILLEVRDATHADGRFLHTPAYFVALRGAPAAGQENAARQNTGGLPAAAVQNGLFRFLLTLTAGILDPHDALSLWEREKRPQRERYGVTLRDGGQWAWLDDPGGPHVWELGGRLSPGGP
jgi:protein-L-isoaspartate O-methyltransferase